MNTPLPTRESCTAGEAAQALGVSTRTIHLLVERGVLDAWRTPGGHRRICRGSLERFLDTRGDAARPASNGVRLLHWEADSGSRADFGQAVRQWPVPIELIPAHDPMHVFVLLERHRPDVLVIGGTTPDMPALQFATVVRRNREFDRTLVVVTDPRLANPTVPRPDGWPRETLFCEGAPRYGTCFGAVHATLFSRGRQAA